MMVPDYAMIGCLSAWGWGRGGGGENCDYCHYYLCYCSYSYPCCHLYCSLLHAVALHLHLPGEISFYAFGFEKGRHLAKKMAAILVCLFLLRCSARFTSADIEPHASPGLSKCERPNQKPKPLDP